MRIAYITYEFPPDIVHGGIATYVDQTTQIMKSCGHEPVIFSAGKDRSVSEIISGVLIHRIESKNPADFRERVLPKFLQEQALKPFDVVESAEINANGLAIKQKYPFMPLVVKLHTPLFLQMKLYNRYTSWKTKLRFFLGALRRGRFQVYGRYRYKQDFDYLITSLAEVVISPSASLSKKMKKEWHLSHDRVQIVPNPFIPSAYLTSLDINQAPDNVVSFIGKLNVHKGIVKLVAAIKIVAKAHPDVLFRLTGHDSYFGAAQMNMSEYIEQELRGFERNYVLAGGIPYNEIEKELAKSAIVVFPSVWENFPYVCLEAMAAGRAVIGSDSGGMSEILAGNAGLLVNPNVESEIARTIILLLKDKLKRVQVGTIAREKVRRSYGSRLFSSTMEGVYRTAIDIIAHKKNKNQR